MESALAGLDDHKGEVSEVVNNVMGTGRAYYAQFPAPLDLYALVRLTRPGTLAESGVAAGISTAFILMAAKSNGGGVLHSIDYPVQRHGGKGNESWAIPEGRSSGWAIPARLKKGWDLRLGRSEDLLQPLLDEIGSLDFYCHDSPVGEAHFEFEMRAILPYLHRGSLVVSDNIDWGPFSECASSMGAEAVRRKGSTMAAFRVPDNGTIQSTQKSTKSHRRI